MIRQHAVSVTTGVCLQQRVPVVSVAAQCGAGSLAFAALVFELTCI
jgi:hypothetical protein